MSRPAGSMQEQFVQVIAQHKGIIYKVSNAYGQDADDQQDLAQEIIFQLWKSYGRYNSQYKISTWMYRIALNVAISHYRKHTVRDRHHLPLEKELIHLRAEEPGELQEEVKLLRQFIRNLSRLNKSLMLLYLDEKSHREIADILDISVSNVGTRISRLKKQLKTYFDKIQP